jgi:oxalate decarboxylase/phosphoglucose isomerase-like protein (cupin superfamily)
VLYVEPWVFHGLINTGDTDLTFFVVKYASKGWPNPPAPAGSHGQ